MPLRVLHVFGQYLHDTENWAFRLIRDIPDCKVLVGAEQFLKCGFYDPRFEFIEFPFRQWDRPRRNILERAANGFISHALLPFYPRWLASQSGPVDIVHAHFGYIGWQYLPTARKLRAPLVVSFYGSDYSRLPTEQPVWRERYRDLFGEAALILCEGSHGIEQLVALGCPREKIAVQHLGIDLKTSVAGRETEISNDWKNAAGRLPIIGNFFAPRTKRPGELRLVQVATMREKKGHIYTAQAFREAFADCPNLTLTFVGGDKEDLKGGVEKALGPALSRVEFLSGIDFARLHEFLRGFHVFIHPSVHAANGDCEGGAPVVLLDAQATGMPVIATRHCDIPEEVRNGETGLLADEKDVAGLAAAIRRFYAMDQAEYDGFATRAARHVAAEYETGRNAAALRARYDEIAAGHRRAGP